MSTTYRSLTFRGSFGEQSRTPNVDTGVSRHHLIDAYGLAALAPHEFEFNMRWQLWDIAILHELSVSKLVKLKLPLGVPSDCFELGCTLRRMSSLKSLTITDIPDHPLFLKNLPYLGLGILSRGASLRELDIWITNYNRPDYYCDTFERVTIEDEAFVKPDSLDWFFGLLFPQSPEDIEDDQREKYLTFKDSISREQGSLINKPRPLKLEKLRFRHVDLPLYAFEDIVDGSFLKELSLPFCDVEQGTWQRIGTTGLVRIADLNYDLLSEELIRFLSAQTSLKSLTFARPADECTASGFVQYPGDESPTLFLQLSKRTPMLGQGTEWGRNSIYGQRLATLRNGSYPSLEELLASISSTELKELYMPADMYDITPVAFSMIGSKLAYLEHLSWGFDYCSPVSFQSLPHLFVEASTNIESQRIRNAFLESFLPKMHCLRRITFLSVNLPSGWNDLQGDSLAFEATMFHDFMRTVSGSIPNILRHVRYQHLIPRDSCGAQQTGTYYYCRQERKDERRWMRLNMLEGEKLFDGDLTPQVV